MKDAAITSRAALAFTSDLRERERMPTFYTVDRIGTLVEGLALSAHPTKGLHPAIAGARPRPPAVGDAQRARQWRGCELTASSRALLPLHAAAAAHPPAHAARPLRHDTGIPPG